MPAEKEGFEMLTREQTLQRLRDNLSFLRQEYGVSSIGLFGSTAADQADEQSDVDIMVEFEQPIGLRFMELAETLETLLGRRVDLVTRTGVETIRVREVAEDILASVTYA